MAYCLLIDKLWLQWCKAFFHMYEMAMVLCKEYYLQHTDMPRLLNTYELCDNKPCLLNQPVNTDVLKNYPDNTENSDAEYEAMWTLVCLKLYLCIEALAF